MEFSKLEIAFLVGVLILLMVILGIWFYDWVKTWRWLWVRRIRKLRRSENSKLTPFRAWVVHNCGLEADMRKVVTDFVKSLSK